VTIPLEIRDRLGIMDGNEIAFEIESGRIILLPPKTIEDPTKNLIGLAEGVKILEPVKEELVKATAKLVREKIKRAAH